jgi:hypothetical protein
MSEGPFEAAFNMDTTGVVRREIVTYRYVNGTIRMETATRTYTGDDYNDSTQSIPMPEGTNG